MDDGAGKSNRLLGSASAYLAAHARDPVDWFPWGEEAFDEAHRRGVPIFLSIGFAACHWCHVMHRESFSDPAIAALLNDAFVCVKVDREEHPAVDAVYMRALHEMTGHGGWPANLFLTPERSPFHGATYLARHARHGQPGFRQLIEQVRDAWAHDPVRVAAWGASARARVAEDAPEGAGVVARDVDAAVAAVCELSEVLYGFSAEGPAFPRPPILELLVHRAASDDRAAALLKHALAVLDDGGLQDHLGGGFHRYCVDHDWTVPHFEKMLVDNAQLLRVYARASSLFAARGWRGAARAACRVVVDTATFLLRDLAHPDGGFCASLDADDEDGEGAFYTFAAWEVRQLLGAGAPLPYGVEAGGHLEGGRCVLTARGGRPSATVRQKLFDARARRPAPRRDGSRVVAHNGLAIGALAEAGRLFGRREWIDAAAAAADVVLAHGVGRRVLGRTAPETLDDVACLADGLLDLLQARPSELRWAHAAADLAARALLSLRDPATGAFFHSSDANLFVRRRPFDDGAEPSGNGKMADVLRRLEQLGCADVPSGALAALFDAGAAWREAAPVASPTLWVAASATACEARRGPETLVLAGRRGTPAWRRLRLTWDAAWRPYAVVAAAAGGRDADRFAALAHKPAGADGAARAYLCTPDGCAPPCAEPAELRALLAGVGSRASGAA